MMNGIRSRHSLFSFFVCFLVLLVTACGGSSTSSGPTTSKTPGASPTSASHTPTGGGHVSGTPTPVTTTVPMPPTQTSCPASGSARAAVMAPLALGTHANIVYTVIEYQGNTLAFGTLKRYDVTTGNKTEIVKLAGTYIAGAEISADGQWILFIANTQTGQPSKLQMVRMDGQGLQTLYCSPANAGIQNALWTTNQKLVAFNSFSNNQGGMYLLDTTSGNLQLELKPANSGPPLNLLYIATPFTWLDNTRLYASFTAGPIAPTDRLGILDTSRGPNQQMSDLTTVFIDKTGVPFNYPCWDADSSYDGSTLFVNQCSGISAPNCSGSCSLGTREGPSAIDTEPGTGGSLHTALTNSRLGIANVRAISSDTLLLLVHNFSQNHQVDTSQNGLWKVNTDGSGLTRLTTETTGVTSSLNQYSQNPWSNVSRDASMYAFANYSYQNQLPDFTLLFGSLNGGSPTTFASINDGTQLAVVGWTTM